MQEFRIEDSLVPIGKGKEGLRGFGFEPAFNEFYDLCASDKVLSEPILRLEDIALYLYLRKCVNVDRDDWKPPSVRHLKRKFRIGADTLYDIFGRLEKAHLLRKVSGVRKDGNIHNQYNLFDPLPEEHFLKAAKAGAFAVPMRDDLEDQDARRGVPASGTITDLSNTDLLETDLEQTDTALAFADDHKEYLAEEVALKLAKQASLEQVEGWIDYIEHRGDSLKSPLGFLISKLRKGKPPLLLNWC